MTDTNSHTYKKKKNMVSSIHKLSTSNNKNILKDKRRHTNILIKRKMLTVRISRTKDKVQIYNFNFLVYSKF